MKDVVVIGAGKIGALSGFIRQEDIPLKVFLENRFGKVYAKPETSVPHQRFGGSGR